MNPNELFESFGVLLKEVYVPGKCHVVLHKEPKSVLGSLLSCLFLCHPYEYTIRAYEAKNEGNEIDYNSPSIVCKETDSISADFAFCDVKSLVLLRQSHRN